MTSEEWDSRPAPPPHDPWESGDEKWIDLTPAERRSARTVITTTLVVVAALAAISIVVGLTRTSALSADSDLVGAGTVPTPTASATARPVPAPALVVHPTPSTTPVAVTPVPSIPPAVDLEPSGVAAVVTDVVDGDTIRVDLPTGIETVRIIGIDTPEVVHPTEPEACFGAEASAFAHGHPRRPGRHPRARPDPGRARPLRPPARPRPRRRHAVRGRGHRRRIRHPLRLRAAEHPRRRAGRRRRRRARCRAWHLGLVRRAASTCPWSRVEPAPVEEPDPEPPANADCHPSYDPCVPNAGHDLDCGDIGFQVAVIGPDEYRLDGSDNDGRGCESY